MLNFEEEVKAVGQGYVVMPLAEYNRLMAERAEYLNMGREAERQASRRIEETRSNYEALLSNLLTVRKQTYGDRSIDIVFNQFAVHQLAVEAIQRSVSPDELKYYELVQAEDLLLFDPVIARRISDTEE